MKDTVERVKILNGGRLDILLKGWLEVAKGGAQMDSKRPNIPRGTLPNFWDSDIHIVVGIND